MKNEKKQDGRFRRALGLDELISDSDHLELRGQNELTVRGCGAILYYSEREIKLSMKKYILKIFGEELYCVSYLAGAVQIDGRIDSLEMQKRGNGG